MIWLLLALLAAFFDTIYFMLIKRAGIFHYTILASGTYFVASIVLLCLSFWNGIPSLGDLFWVIIAGDAILSVLLASIYFRVMPHTDLSLSVPMLAFTPIFVIITSFFILQELPSFYGLFGVLLIVLGSYVLNLHHIDRHILAPFHALLTHQGTRGMLIVAVLSGLAIPLDRWLMIESDAYFGAAILGMIMGATFLVMGLSTNHITFHRCKKSWNYFIPLGVLMALSLVCFNLSAGHQILAYVLSLKRLSILFSVLVGYFMFKEKHITQRLVGAGIMLVGVIVIVVT